MMKRRLVFILAALLAEGCSYGHKPVDPKSLAPNPHLGTVVRIKGVVPKGFSVEQLQLTYSTNSTSPFCNGLNFPDGGPFPRVAQLTVPTKTIGGVVNGQIHPDWFAPGFCRWQLAKVTALLKSPNGETDTPLIAIGYQWYKGHGLLGAYEQPTDTSTFSCGRKHGDFSCEDGEEGDTRYFPVELKPNTDHANFVITASKYKLPTTFPMARAPS